MSASQQNAPAQESMPRWARILIALSVLAIIMGGFNLAMFMSPDLRGAVTGQQQTALSGDIDQSDLENAKPKDTAKGDSKQDQIDKLTAKVASLQKQLDGDTDDREPAKVTSQQRQAVAKWLKSMGWQRDQLRFNHFADDATERGNTSFSKGVIDTRKELVKYLHADTPQASATRASMRKNLSDKEYQRAMRGEGYVPVQLLAPGTYEGNTYFRSSDGAAVYTTHPRNVAAYDVIWVYTNAQHEVEGSGSVRADCGNVRVTRVVPQQAVKTVRAVAYVQHQPPKPPTVTPPTPPTPPEVPPEQPPTTPPDKPTCEDTPNKPECQETPPPEKPTCEDTPNAPECQPEQPPTCEEKPEQPKCQPEQPPTCEDTPNKPECQETPPPTCEENPDQPKCEETPPPTCEEQPDQDKCQETPPPTCEENPDQDKCNQQPPKDKCEDLPKGSDGYCGTPDEGAEQQPVQDNDPEKTKPTDGYDDPNREDTDKPGPAEKNHKEQSDARDDIDSGKKDDHDPTKSGVEVTDPSEQSNNGGSSDSGSNQKADPPQKNPDHDGSHSSNPDNGTGGNPDTGAPPDDTPAQDNGDTENGGNANSGDPLGDMDLP